jgi:hypothetical protein
MDGRRKKKMPHLGCRCFKMTTQRQHSDAGRQIRTACAKVAACVSPVATDFFGSKLIGKEHLLANISIYDGETEGEEAISICIPILMLSIPHHKIHESQTDL